MNAKRFVTLTLILTLSLVCLLDCYALLYPSDAFDFTTLNTKRTLEARHIIIAFFHLNCEVRFVTLTLILTLGYSCLFCFSAWGISP